MKVTVDMDMTPEEARKLMGLPDVEPFQAAMMKNMQQHIESYINQATDPEAFLKQFMPMGLQATEHFTQFYNTLLQSAYGNTKRDSEK
jgi:O6-methylguanine-DNA--protein-cysteine methyltransferase